MQSLNQFAEFQLDTQETINVNGGTRFGSTDLRAQATTSRFRVIGRRFGKRNTTLLDGTDLNSLGNLSSYSAYDGAGYEQILAEANAETLEHPGIDPNVIPADQIIL